MDSAQKEIVGYLVGKEELSQEHLSIPKCGAIIGRDAHVANTVISHSLVSRCHFKLDINEKGQVVLTDLESTNGTFVNGHPISSPVVLSSGDHIGFDRSGKLIMVFEPAGQHSKKQEKKGSGFHAVMPNQNAIRYDWTDPKEWLTLAFQAENRPVDEAEKISLPRNSSLKAQAKADLAIYDQALNIFQKLIDQGHKKHEIQAAALCLDKAFILETLDQHPEAAAAYDRAIDIYNRLVDKEGHLELAAELATICINKAGLVWAMGDHRAALSLCDNAVEIREWLVNNNKRQDLRGDLARAKSKRAVVFLCLDNTTMAVKEGKEAIDMLKEETAKTARPDLQADLDWATNALKCILH
ncbi:MAG: FHA domain-containing protein [Verrucomicrobiae bacterium]|nr:FHA domain-containing protein [Verrucomicrobiae bacterium]